VAITGVDTQVTRDGPYQPRMTVVATGGPPKTRRVYKTPHVGPDSAMGIHNNSLRNLRRGLLERVFFVELDGTLQPPPQPLRDVFAARAGDVRKRLLKVLPKLTPWSAEQFCATYVGRRRATYEATARELTTRLISRQDGYLRTFVKAEKVDFTVKGDPAPRVIQPRAPAYILETGRYLKQMEHPVFRGLADVWGHRRDGGKVVMKGLSPYGVAEQLQGKWLARTRPVAVGLDASRFDQHVSAQALMFEHSIYLNCFVGEDRAYLKQLLEWQVSNKGVGRASDGYVKYTVDGCRGSGDINTSLGNCLLMCVLVKAFCESVGLTRVDLANNGDDCVLFMEEEDLHRLTTLKAWFRDMGFTMKVEEPVREFERIEFCQGHPVWTPEGWLMVRNLKTALSKDAITILDMRYHAKRVWHAVGTCGLSIAGGVPVFDRFYKCFQRAGSARGLEVEQDAWYNSSGFFRMSRGMNRSDCHIHPLTRYSFWRAFGVTPDEQIALETYYDMLTLVAGARSETQELSSVYPKLL